VKREGGFTLIEMIVATSIIAVLAGVVLLNLGTFFGAGKAEAMETEKHQVISAVAVYRVDGHTITQAFTVGPLSKGVLDPYLFGTLQHNWLIGTDGSVSPGPAYLFSSELNSLAGFISLMGSWSAAGGVLNPSTIPYQNRLVVAGGPWTDFTYETTAQLLSGNGYGLYYRCDSNPNITGYVFQFDPGLGNKFVVRKVTGGNESSPFQTVSMPPGFQVNGQHKISVSVQGDHQVIKVDGATVMDFRDSTFSSGTVGLRSWAYSNVNFTNLNVTPQ